MLLISLFWKLRKCFIKIRKLFINFRDLNLVLFLLCRYTDVLHSGSMPLRRQEIQAEIMYETVVLNVVT